MCLNDIFRNDENDCYIREMAYRKFVRRSPVRIVKWDPREYDPSFDYNIGLNYIDRLHSNKAKLGEEFVTVITHPPGQRHYDIMEWYCDLLYWKYSERDIEKFNE